MTEWLQAVDSVVGCDLRLLLLLPLLLLFDSIISSIFKFNFKCYAVDYLWSWSINSDSKTNNCTMGNKNYLFKSNATDSARKANYDESKMKDEKWWSKKHSIWFDSFNYFIVAHRSTSRRHCLCMSTCSPCILFTSMMVARMRELSGVRKQKQKKMICFYGGTAIIGRSISMLSRMSDTPTNVNAFCLLNFVRQRKQICQVIDEPRRFKSIKNQFFSLLFVTDSFFIFWVLFLLCHRS